jgi:hypothetical protein
MNNNSLQSSVIESNRLIGRRLLSIAARSIDRSLSCFSNSGSSPTTFIRGDTLFRPGDRVRNPRLGFVGHRISTWHRAVTAPNPTARLSTLASSACALDRKVTPQMRRDAYRSDVWRLVKVVGIEATQKGFTLTAREHIILAQDCSYSRATDP